jgi:large subunit ribosomal protein L7Ae
MGKGKFKKGTKTTKVARTKKNPLFEKSPRNFRIGGDIQPTRDLTRFVRWPKYIRLQRQKRVLLQRLKVPPALNQFTKTLDRNKASAVLRLLKNYTPETAQKKRERLAENAKAKTENREATLKAPTHQLKYGLNEITRLVEEKKAKLVLIAHDVDPIETIVWLPALCRKQNVPFAFIKSKARLGKLCDKKTVTAVAVTAVRKEHQAELENFEKEFRAQYNESTDLQKTWGGAILGHKANLAREAHLKAVENEKIKKSNL